MRNKLVLIIIAAGFLLRLGYALSAGVSFTYDDECAYHNAAVQPGGADGWFSSTTREPLYPAFLSLVYRLTGTSIAAVRIIQAMLSTATLYIVYLAAGLVFSPLAAFLALLFAAFYPFFIFYSAFLLRETLLVFFSALLLYLTLLPPTTRRCSAAAIVAGLATLAKATFMPFWILLAVTALALRRITAVRFAYALAVFVIVLSPLLIRNFVMTGKPFLVRGQGFNAYAPLVLPKDKYGAPDENTLLRQDRVYAEGRSLPLDIQDRYFARAVGREITGRPRHFLDRVWWRFAKLWRVVPYSGRNYAHGSRLLAWLSILSYGWLLPCAVIGAILLAGRFRELYPLYLLPAVFSLVHALTWSQIRYRLPLDIVVILFAAYTVSLVINTLNRRARASHTV